MNTDYARFPGDKFCSKKAFTEVLKSVLKQKNCSLVLKKQIDEYKVDYFIPELNLAMDYVDECIRTDYYTAVEDTDKLMAKFKAIKDKGYKVLLTCREYLT